MSIVGILVFGAIGLVGWQIYHYLQVGQWQPISVITALQYCEVGWAYNPTKWIGLYRVLDFIPLSLASFVTAGLATLMIGIFPSSPR
jgi:hypothetical protein